VVVVKAIYLNLQKIGLSILIIKEGDA